MDRSNIIRAKHDLFNDARKLYFDGTYTLREISDLTGVPYGTLRNWVRDGQWRQLRQNANQTPMLILDNLLKQLTGIQKQVLARENASPTHHEAETQGKLINSINNTKEYPDRVIRMFSQVMHTISDIQVNTDMEDENNEEEDWGGIRLAS